MGYDDLKVIEALELLRSVKDGRPRGARLEDAVRCAVVLQAMSDSAEQRRWVDIPVPEPS
jgi:hypothetical protein